MLKKEIKKKGWIVFLAGLAMAFVFALGGFSMEARAADTDTQTMYRLYNPNSGEHFYTASTVERDNLDSIGWNYEGVAWNAPINSSTPVYRLYNANAGDHHYTMSTTERDWLVSLGWSYEGIGWYSADSNGVTLYRLYNPNATTGTHHYTESTTERDNLVSLGWNYEGTAWYGAHTHSYTAKVTKEATCSTAGVKTYTCSCGDSYTEAIPATGNHTWQNVTEQVLVDGGTYTVDEIVGYKPYWICSCGQKWYDRFELSAHHEQSVLDEDPNNTCGGSIKYTEAVVETKTYENPDYYETVVTGQKCTVCGATK